MIRTELESALQQQQAENAVLRAELARMRSTAESALTASSWLPSNNSLLVYLMQEQVSAVVLTDETGLITWVNKGFSALCGLESHEVLGQDPKTVLRPNLTDPATLAYIEEGLRTKTPFQYEVPNPHRNKSGGWIRVKVQPVYDENYGGVIMARLLEDITEWKKTQFNLAESEHRFHVLAENVPGVLFEWNKKTDGPTYFSYLSPKIYELFGIPAEEMIRVSEYMHPSDVTALLESIRHAIRTQTPWTFEGRLLVPGQPLRWFQSNATLTAHSADEITYSGILLDITALKLAKSALRESDMRWRLAVAGFGDGAWERNFTTDEMHYSTSYKSMLGYQAEEFPSVAKKWHSHVHLDDRAAAAAAFERHLQGESPLYASQHRLLCKDGTYVWVLSRGIITERDAQGQPLIFTGSNTDISELKKAETALEASSRRLSTVISNFQAGLVLEDENRNIVLVNDALCELLRVPTSPAQLIGKAGAWLAEKSKLYFKNPDQYSSRIATLLDDKKPVAGDVLVTNDGRILQRDFTPIYDQDRYIGQLWKFEDITVRTKAEEDLKLSEEKYRGIIENMSMGLIEADLQENLLYANESFCEMTGFRSHEFTDSWFSQLQLSSQDLELVESKAGLRQYGIADSYEIAITTKSGAAKWLLMSGAPLYDDAQKLVGTIGICLDVTPQKRLEASLREAKAVAEVSTRVKQDFLANMSHEIRTPMNAILGMSQLLVKTSLDDSQASYLNAIRSSAENLLVIINNILDLSKIEAGRMTVEKIGFSLKEVCAQVEKTLLYKAEEKGLSFISNIADQIPAVLIGDPYRITQILLNLAGNSVKFTDKGAINITCAMVEPPANGEALIEVTVQDTGVGIDAEYLAQIFDDFSQEDSTITRKFGGTGLGLGISKKLVELLGGELAIESQKNEGTTSRFTLRLPVGEDEEAPHKDGGDVSELQHALCGKRILLVEDNVFNRMLAKIFLTNAEMDVTEAENGQVAVTLAQGQRFDLILMDVQMPVMNGYEATAFLRNELSFTIPIIALTANAISGEREKCLDAGMNDYLTKPFQEASLIKMVYDWVVGPMSAP